MTEIRRAGEEDIPSILNIYKEARLFMASHNNPDQWGDDYPELDIVKDDIRKNQLFLVTLDSLPVAVFSLSGESERAYDEIEGAWECERPYGVIHRVAKRGEKKGISKLIFDYAKEKFDYIRVDTHRANTPMQNALVRYGFKERGTVYYTRNGRKTSRIAFDFLSRDDSKSTADK